MKRPTAVFAPPSQQGHGNNAGRLPGPGLFCPGSDRFDLDEIVRTCQPGDLHGRTRDKIGIRLGSEERAVTGIEAGKIHPAIQFRVADHEHRQLDDIRHGIAPPRQRRLDLAQRADRLRPGVAIGGKAIGSGWVDRIGDLAAEHQDFGAGRNRHAVEDDRWWRIGVAFDRRGLRWRTHPDGRCGHRDGSDHQAPLKLTGRSQGRQPYRHRTSPNREKVVGPEGVQNSLKTNDIFCLTY